MSRNKQVDKLANGLVEVLDHGQMTEKDLKDPVQYALDQLRIQKDEMFSLTKMIIEDKEFFEELHAEMFSQGCSEALVINRKSRSDVTLGMLGWVNQNPKFETREDRAKIIAINGMVMAHLRGLVLEERKTNKRFLKRANEQYSKATDKLNTTMMELGIWKDPMPGEFYGMLDLFGRSYEQMHKFADEFRQQRDIAEASLKTSQYNAKTLLDQRDLQISDQKGEMARLYKVIEDMTQELKYQNAAAKQYARENDMLRADIIKREIS
mgnify:FL=1